MKERPGRTACRDAHSHTSRARAERYFNAHLNAERLARILAADAERREA